jgi:hypothetical protein
MASGVIYSSDAPESGNVIHNYNLLIDIDNFRRTLIQFAPLANPPHAHLAASIRVIDQGNHVTANINEFALSRPDRFGSVPDCLTMLKRTGPRLQAAAFIVLLTAAPAANAYLIGGHHYTPTAVFQENIRYTKSPEKRNEKVVEAFCAQLPDLSRELNAPTQRANVFWSSDAGWSMFSSCWTNKARHMVAAQYYLHALTGTPVIPVRSAAERTIANLRQARSANKDAGERIRLSCAIGLAFHLLGDTYAHAELDHPDKLYPTGMGHFRHMVAPDDMLSRNSDYWKNISASNDWQQWLSEVYKILDERSPSGEIGKLSQGISITGKDYGEQQFQAKLVGHLGSEQSVWEPYAQYLETWNTPGSDLNWIMKKYRASILGKDKLCAAQVARAQSAINLPGKPEDFCQNVWELYLNEASSQFAQAFKGGDDNLMGSCRADQAAHKDQLQFGQ